MCRQHQIRKLSVRSHLLTLRLSADCWHKPSIFLLRHQDRFTRNGDVRGEKSYSSPNWVIPLGSDQQFEVNMSRKDKRESLRDYSEAKIEILFSCLSPGFDLPSTITFTIRRQWRIWQWMKGNSSSQHFVSGTPVFCFWLVFPLELDA